MKTLTVHRARELLAEAWEVRVPMPTGSHVWITGCRGDGTMLAHCFGHDCLGKRQELPLCGQTASPKHGWQETTVCEHECKQCLDVLRRRGCKYGA